MGICKLLCGMKTTAQRNRKQTQKRKNRATEKMEKEIDHLATYAPPKFGLPPVGPKHFPIGWTKWTVVPDDSTRHNQHQSFNGPSSRYTPAVALASSMPCAHVPMCLCAPLLRIALSLSSPRPITAPALAITHLRHSISIPFHCTFTTPAVTSWTELTNTHIHADQPALHSFI